MSDPFESSRRKIARGKKHIADLRDRQAAFFQQKPYITFVEADPEVPEHIVHKLKLVEPIHADLSEITGDAAANLRAALDHACYAIAVAGGKANPKAAYFPLTTFPEFELENVIKRRCKDLLEDILTLCRTFKPYGGGNDALAGLNAICNADKHRILTRLGVRINHEGIVATTYSFMSIPNPAVWDDAKNEIELFTCASDATFEAEVQFTQFVAFGQIEIVSGKPALAFLNHAASEVERVLLALEAEAGRIGLI